MTRVARAQVLALVRRWQVRLGLEGWEIRVRCTTRLDALAECHASPEYFDAHLVFNVKRLTPETLEATVVHELLHCHTWPLWALAEEGADGDPVRVRRIEEAHEALTSTLQRVVMR